MSRGTERLRGAGREAASLWPGGLVGRVTVVLLVALALEFLGSTVLVDQLSQAMPEQAALAAVAERLADTARVLGAVAPGQRPDVAHALSFDDLVLDIPSGAAVAAPSRTMPGRTGARLLEAQPVLRQYGMVLEHDTPEVASGTLRLPDGAPVRFVLAPVPTEPHPVFNALFSTAVLAGCVLAAAALVVQTLAAPLRRLAQVADTIGRGPTVPVSDRGPREVRQVARAFNAMQDRLARLLADQTEALAAVSHDLRTPIGRLRLRAGLLDDEDAAQAIEADLAEMEAMVSAVLAFLAGEADPEARRTLDFAVLVSTLAEEAADAGRDVTFEGPAHAVLTGRPLELKRAVGNLLDNAVKYGGSARLVLDRPEPGTVRLRVSDRGPGIPEDQLLRVLEPFRRVDGSRSAETGGLGLGLAIVRRAVERDGGRLVLSNLPDGGLCAAVTLPGAAG